MVFNKIEGLREAIAGRIAQAMPEVQVIRDPLWVRREPGAGQPVVSVLVDSIQTRKLGFTDYLGLGGGQARPPGEQYGKEVTLGLRLDIYHRQGGQDCYQLFAALGQVLMLESFSPALDSLTCGDAAYDRVAGAFHLVCRGQLRGCLGVSAPNPVLDSLEIRRVAT